MEEEYLARRDIGFQTAMEQPMPEYLWKKAGKWGVPFVTEVKNKSVQKILRQKITAKRLSGAFSDTLYVPFSTVLLMEETLMLVPDFTLGDSNIDWFEEMASRALGFLPAGIAIKWNRFYQGLWIYSPDKIENLRAKIPEDM